MKAADIDREAGGIPERVSLVNLLGRAAAARGAAWLDLPAAPGIYAVCLPGWELQLFAADAGRARHAEPADPRQLDAKRDGIPAAGPTDILYIGKAGAAKSSLRKRVRQLARFGVGRTKDHRGGEWLWQLRGIDEALVRMWCCPRGRPEPLERELLARFRDDHGDWPLANRN